MSWCIGIEKRQRVVSVYKAKRSKKSNRILQDGKDEVFSLPLKNDSDPLDICNRNWRYSIQSRMVSSDFCLEPNNFDSYLQRGRK